MTHQCLTDPPDVRRIGIDYEDYVVEDEEADVDHDRDDRGITR